MLSFVFVAIAFTSILLTWSTFRFFQKTIEQDYNNILRTSASEIDLFMDTAITDLKTLSYTLQVGGLDDWRMELIFAAFQFNKPHFRHIQKIDIDNLNSFPLENNNPEDERLANRVTQKALTEEFALSSVVVGDPPLPRIHMAAPVTHMGKIKAVLYAKLNLKYIWDVLEGITIGDTGGVFILDQSGFYMAHREMNYVATGYAPYGSSRLQTIKSSPNPVKWFELEGNTRYFCLGTHLSSRDWVVVLRQALPEIYAYLYTSIFWTMGITITACLLAIILGTWHIRRVLRPIETMHRQVRRIGQGDLDQHVSVAANNELGDLAEAFNDMAASLKATIEREVQTATKLAHARDLAVLGASAAKVTHEVGNLLNNMGMLVNALNRETFSETGQRVLAGMEKESARVKDFVQKFLQFAKPPELNITPTALDLIIHEAFFARQQTGKSGIEFELDWPKEIPWVPVDVRLMYQVFTNLLKNATEAIETSGLVRVSATVEKPFLKISVQDNGCGITPENRKRVFEPFFTTKGNAGLGLGMATVQSIVTAHRGSIECHSNVGTGTQMIIRLPL